MPKCSECRYEGPYSVRDGQRAVFVFPGGVEETEMKYMRCQAPGGGPTQNPISIRESLVDQPCEFYQPKEKPTPRKGISSLLSRLFGRERHPGVRFKGKTVQGRNTYEVYAARTKDEALSFLRSRSVADRLYYIVVETPEGNWGLDIDGIYQEK